MISIEQILSLIVMHLLIFIIPGPNTALIIRNTMKYGFRIGAFSALGITAAITLHAAFALVAVNALIKGFYEYFYYIKITGVLYVASVGVTFIKSSLNSSALATVVGPSTTADHLPLDILSTTNAIRMGFFLDLFNPYIPLFYMGVCPTYLVNADSFSSIPVFGGVVSVLNLSWFSGLAYLVAYSQRRTRFKVNPQFLELFTGVAMIVFALFLFLKS